MNDVLKLLENHCSIRKFKAQSISPEMLAELVRAGQSASTSSYIQAVSVVRVLGSEHRAAFAKLSGGQQYVESAAEFLVFCADLNRNQARIEGVSGEKADFGWTEQFIAATVDVALFAQNVVVAAESYGLGCCYIGGIRNDPDAVTQLINLPNLVYPVFGLCLGYPDQNPAPKPRLPLVSVLHQGVYSSAGSVKDEIDEYDANVRQYYVDRTKGKLSFTWSEQMTKQAATQKRSFMLNFVKKQGFIEK